MALSSNQIYKNNTELYPFIRNANTVQGGAGGSEGRIVDIRTVLDAEGSFLQILEQNSGTFQDPDVAVFNGAYTFFEDNTPVPAGAGLTTAVYDHDFGPLRPGEYRVEVFMQASFGAVAGNETFDYRIEYTNLIDPLSLPVISSSVQQAVFNASDNTFNAVCTITVPAATTENRIRLLINTVASAANQTKNLANVKIERIVPFVV